MKYVWLIIFLINIVWGYLYIFPIRLRLQRKLGSENLGNKIKYLAKKGDLDALRIMKFGYIFLVIGLISGLFLVVSKYIK